MQRLRLDGEPLMRVCRWFALIGSLVLCVPMVASAQVSLGDTVTPVAATAATSASVSKLISAANVMVIHCAWHDASSSTSVTASATWNGSSGTAISSAVTVTSGSDVYYAQDFILASPASGSHAAVCTISTTDDVQVGFQTFNGTDASNPVRVGTFTSATGTGTGPSLTISEGTTDLTVTSLVEHGSGGTSDQTRDGIQSAGPVRGAYDHQTTAGGTSTTHTWTIGSSPYAIIGFAVCASGTGCAGATATPHNLLLLGVGGLW